MHLLFCNRLLEEADDLPSIILTRKIQRRLALGIFEREVGLLLQKRLNQSGIAALRCLHEGRLAR